MKTSKSYYVGVILMPIWHILQGIKAGVGVGGGHKEVKGDKAVGRRVTWLHVPEQPKNEASTFMAKSFLKTKKKTDISSPPLRLTS